MAVQFFNDVCTLAGGYDLSGHSNKASLAVDAEELDVTTFASGGSKEVIGGLKGVEFSLAGLFEAGGENMPDDAANANLSIVDTPLTVAPSAVDGGVAYGVNAVQLKYMLGGQVGQVMPFELSARGRTPGVARGYLLHPPGTARTATGTGTAQQLGTLGATQKLLALLHVVSVSGTATPTLTVTLQRDDNGGFSSPTTVTTFTAATAIGSQSYNTAGPITPDDRYRITYTISGTNPIFKFAVFVGAIS